MQTLIAQPNARTNRTLEMSALEIESALRAFDRIERQRDLDAPGRDNCRAVLRDMNRARSGRLVGGRRIM